MNDQSVVSIKGLSKAKVLAALFNASAPLGMGFLQAGNGPEVMTVEYAEQLIGNGNTATPDYGGMSLPGWPGLYFDYLYGRPLKLDLTEDESFIPSGFDRDNGGPGTAQRIIDKLRASSDVNPPESEEARVTATKLNAHKAMEMAGTVSSLEGNTWTLGADEFGEPLEKAVDATIDRLE